MDPNHFPGNISRPIYRKQVRQYLAMVAVLAMVSTSCKGNNPKTSQGSGAGNKEKIEALYYTSVAECKTDTTNQAKEYQVLVEAHKAGKLTNAPTPPPIRPEECEAQMKAAREEHQRNAPVYRSQADCQTDGVICEPTPSGYHTSGYRPVFGGAYFYPYGNNYTYIYSGGVQRRVLQPSIVYRGTSPDQLITPNGVSVPRTTTGKVSISKAVTAPAPPRPSGTAAKGTISGRSSNKGFGSTFKGTGRGGK
jgi:uncharacterized protein YgiB involved in biofilm formation